MGLMLQLGICLTGRKILYSLCTWRGKAIKTDEDMESAINSTREDNRRALEKHRSAAGSFVLAGSNFECLEPRA